MRIFVCALLMLVASGARAQQPTPSPQPTPPTPANAMPSATPAVMQGATMRPNSPNPSAATAVLTDDAPPVVTHHEIRVGGRSLRYSVTTGMMPIKNRDGVTEANIFYMAYTRDDVGNDRGKRPLMFSFNGGPGSASVWLHLGALGPRRVRMQDDGLMPAPPYVLEDNQQTWLDMTDIVFIDPVGTGYSRAAKPELAQKFFGVNGDIEAIGEFIRLYLTRGERWSSPLYLVGESYGTTRAAGLSGYLFEKGIALNGIVLVSTVMNFQTLLFASGNDLPLQLILPSYTATAWYHKKLPADLQGKPLREVLNEAERFAAGDYALALHRADQMTPDERRRVIEQMARYTGLSAQFIDNADLRVPLDEFNKELLRDRRRTTGRLDSRFTGIDARAGGDSPDFDPSLTAIRPPYTSAFNDYVRRELNYKTDTEYYILGGGVGRWDWNTNNGYADTSVSLRSALQKNPFMKVFVACGYFDMATPYYAAEYSVAHMNLDPSLRRNISFAYYEAGHMMYIDVKSLAQLKTDVTRFMAQTVNAK